METMVCSRCGESKDVELFTKSNRTKDGQRGLCKACKQAADAAWRAKNKDRTRQYFHERWRSDPERRAQNRQYKELRRAGLDATKYVKDKTCEICGMNNDQHFERYGERLHIHHADNIGRRNIREGMPPIHNRLKVLCRSCHVSEDNRMRDYTGRGKKIWETRRRKAENE